MDLEILEDCGKKINEELQRRSYHKNLTNSQMQSLREILKSQDILRNHLNKTS